MTIYMIRETDARFIIAAGGQDVLACHDQTIALKIAALAVITPSAPLPLGDDDPPEAAPGWMPGSLTLEAAE